MNTQINSTTQFRMRCKAVLRREVLHAALILLLLLNVLFFPCLWRHKSMLDSAELCYSVLPTGAWGGTRAPIRWSRTGDAAAAAWFFEPLLAFTGYEYKQEKALPLWNPYQGYGTPFAANMQSQPFYPLTLLLSLHLTPRTYSLYLLSRLFIAGLFSYLFVRLFASFISAMAAAIGTLLSGYYVLYVNMPHLSVEIFIPAALYAAELLLRFPRYRTMLGFTAVIFFVVLGGMPESSILLFAFVCAYVAMRIVTEEELRRSWIQLTVRFAAASVAGLALSSFLILPFVELMHHGFDTHQPRNVSGALQGLAHLPLDPMIATYIFPLIYGPYRLYNSTFGIVIFFLVLIALMTAFRRSHSVADSRLRALTFFCFCCALLLICKRYGIEPINNIGRLPLFRYVTFFKYGEAVTSVCMAVLGAVGIERLLRGQARKVIIAVAFGLSCALIPIAAVGGQSTMHERLKALSFDPRIPELAIGIAVAALVLTAICLARFGSRGGRIALCMLAILTAELSLNYIPELYYPDDLPNESQNPYAGAPYIKFLKENRIHLERLFGRDTVLYPDWASAFELEDIRDLDAMYYWKYLPFIRNFVTVKATSPDVKELSDRFTGLDATFAFDSPVEKRLLQLSSAKYLLSVRPYADPSFKLVYDREVKIYQYDGVLPRAAVYSRVEIAPDDGVALKKLADPSLNLFETAVVTSQGLKGPQAAAIQQLNHNRQRPVESAEISSYGSQSVEIHAALDQPGLLVLNDSGYPGWKVTVDGSRTEWLNANFLFRGVLLPKGRHVVRFVYQPRTFYTGCAIALVTLICLLLPLLGSRWLGRIRNAITRRQPGRAEPGVQLTLPQHSNRE